MTGTGQEQGQDRKEQDWRQTFFSVFKQATEQDETGTGTGQDETGGVVSASPCQPSLPPVFQPFYLMPTLLLLSSNLSSTLVFYSCLLLSWRARARYNLLRMAIWPIIPWRDDFRDGDDVMVTGLVKMQA